MEQRILVVLSIPGSLRKQSTNSRLLSSIEGMMPTGVEFRLYDGLASLPHFSPDLDGDEAEPHEAVYEWREKLRSADAIVICTPEYARGVPGSLKNALDWVVSSGEVHEYAHSGYQCIPACGGWRDSASIVDTDS